MSFSGGRTVTLRWGGGNPSQENDPHIPHSDAQAGVAMGSTPDSRSLSFTFHAYCRVANGFLRFLSLISRLDIETAMTVFLFPAPQTRVNR